MNPFPRSVRRFFGHLSGTFGCATPLRSLDQLGFQQLESLMMELGQWILVGGDAQELNAYFQQDALRFFYTLSLVPDQTGRLLELGACPYYTTHLLRWLRRYELCLANYFGETEHAEQCHQVVHKTTGQMTEFRFRTFNIESDEFPYPAESFDIVLCCEILEHLTYDPAHAISEINRMLTSNGICILTTPNVNHATNIRKLLLGQNIYDQYSGYGPYGRHNREYTIGEAQHMLALHGFTIETCFTANVKPHLRNPKQDMLDHVIRMLTRQRKHDLGEYLFIRAQKVAPCQPKHSHVFYRSRTDILQEY